MSLLLSSIWYLFFKKCGWSELEQFLNTLRSCKKCDILSKIDFNIISYIILVTKKYISNNGQSYDPYETSMKLSRIIKLTQDATNWKPNNVLVLMKENQLNSFTI